MKYLIIAFVLSVSLQAQGYINWQPPVKKAHKGASKEHNAHGSRKAKQLQLHNSNPNATSEAFYIMPTLEKHELALADGLVSLPRTGMANYHALVINQTDTNSVKSSVRYIYGHGRPSKISPTKITQMKKSELEIAPAPLPREHDRYKGSNSYKFELHFKGEALANTKVELITSNGSKETFKSDEDGEFKVTMPNDFKEVKKGRRANRPAEFMLKASHIQDGITYASTFAMPYHVNPTDYWQSKTFGLTILFIGLIIGIFMFRNINKKKKRKA